MFKKLVMGIAAFTGAFTLASCGGSDSEFTIFLYQEGVVYSDTMPVFQRANEYAGITLEGILQKNDTNYDSIYNLRGKNASIVVNDQDTIEATALREGLFADLTNLIEEHAPNLKAYFDSHPQQKEWATASDGKIYGIPFYTEGETAKGYFVRMDWVKKLEAAGKLPAGLKATQESLNTMTVEQFGQLLRAFKNNKSILTDADNIYPYFDRDSDFAISELSSLWGATADYYLDDNGKVHYGVLEDSFRDALNHIIEWYKDGLIDPEILTESTEDKRVTYYAQDSGGVTHDWIGTTYSFNSDVYAANLVDDFEVVCILPPARADGTRFEPTTRKLIGNVTAISSDLSEEEQIKLITWIDFFFSKEGQDLANFGVKDVDYTVAEDGSYVYTDQIVNDNNTALANLYNIGAQLQNAGVQTFAYEEAWLSPEAAQAMEDYVPYLNTGYNDLIYPNAKLSSSDYNTVNTAKSAIAELLEQNIASWLRRGTSIGDSEWSEFVASLEKAGANNVVSILQATIDAKK